jgi:hypothetical protein
VVAITGAVAGGSQEGTELAMKQQIPLVQTNIRRHGRKSFPTYHTKAALCCAWTLASLVIIVVKP